MNIRRMWHESTIEGFALQHDLTLEMHRRDGAAQPQYFCRFGRCEVMDNGLLVGAHGNGETEAEAIADYAAAISGRRLAVNAYLPTRYEIDVPVFRKVK